MVIYLKNITFFIFVILCLSPSNSYPQKKLLDDFNEIKGWTIFKSDGVDAAISPAEGYSGKAVKFSYDFTKGSGYGGIQKFFPINLPDNFQFTFRIKAESPNNNFEIKFLDESGENVWWVNNRNFEFPQEWKTITIKKRHISFAWGPAEDKDLKKINRIEFTIASFSGGKGSIIIDDLYFEELPPISKVIKPPVITGIDSKKIIKSITDNDPATLWDSRSNGESGILIDMQDYREIGGLVINWDKNNIPAGYDILISKDNSGWEKIYSASEIKEDKSFIRLPGTEARYIKIIMPEGQKPSAGITELSVVDPEYSENLNRFFINIAKNYQRGYFPRYFYEEASYWTITGVNSDVKEALISEDGTIEVDKGAFSIEPMLYSDNRLITWNDAITSQSLLNDYLPIPGVEWKVNDLQLKTETFTHGEANRNSTLYITYKIKNIGSSDKNGKLFLLIRPFQVNPYYQELNLTGGVSGISSINITDSLIQVDNNKFIYPLSSFNDAGTMKFEEGNIVSFLAEGIVPAEKTLTDKSKLGSGVMSFDFYLREGEEKVISVAVPFYGRTGMSISELSVDDLKIEVKDYWEKKVSLVKFKLPQKAQSIINTFKSNLAYILINRDNAGIQPGSRSYERSWIRDGSLTSSALLKSGMKDEVREFINWYSEYQYDNGKIPCVVDSRGPDPVPENDSHGEYLFLLKQYYNFTKDTSTLRIHNPRIIKTVEYINSLIDQRSTEHFKNGNDSVRAYYGIMPESISHEGYSAKPVHSYWDNFFTIRGLKDAADIQRILDEDKLYKSFSDFRDEFSKNLYTSIDLAMKTRDIDYIPGCVELGDFDPTSTTIALYPCNEYPNLPQPELSNTFIKYYDFFTQRRDGQKEWINYTPYEVRTIGSFIFLDKPEIAHELISFFMNHRRPAGWNHWAEVVWNEERKPAFIGDMPHTWVGSDFINAVRALFVYENDYDSSIVIGAGLHQDWIDSPDGMAIENLPTYYGELSYAVKKDQKDYIFNITGNLDLPSGNIIIRNFNSSKLPVQVLLNGREITNYSGNIIKVDQFPAELIIRYQE
jgi:hypothetical protein